jgi:hypothetical protein
VSTLLWFLGFALMMASFTFLFGRSEERTTTPRISIDRRSPGARRDRR